LIAGGLGYIGSALTDLIKDDTSIEQIILDKKFIPERIANLPLNAAYIEGNIKDIGLMKSVVKSVDVLFLLAAEVEAEQSVHKEQAVWENNFEAPKNLIELCNSNVRVIFTSTGNVFGGINENEKYLNLTEEDMPKPKYPYAEAKRKVEEYLLSSNKNFTICRLGTNYGYAPGIRFNLVTNNFIKKAIMGSPLFIHGRGDNYRPTVCVRDAAKALSFLSTKKEAEQEIFHVVQANYKIVELARSVLEFSKSRSELEFVAKEVPFSSYHLISDKLKNLGFQFLWDLDKATSDLIRNFRAIKRVQTGDAG
jgi:UDP-glucose 4-epimerase